MEEDLKNAKRVKAVKWDGRWIAVVDLADGRHGYGNGDKLLSAIEEAIEDARFEKPSAARFDLTEYDKVSAYPPGLARDNGQYGKVSAVIAHDLAHGAAPALATSQTVRELIEEEKKGSHTP